LRAFLLGILSPVATKVFCLTYNLVILRQNTKYQFGFSSHNATCSNLQLIFIKEDIVLKHKLKISLLALLMLSLNACTGVILKEATFAPLKAKQGQEQALADFLIEGAALVSKTEPKTLVWAGLKNKEGMMIFDAFEDASGREAHFAGQVAAALKENAEALVQGGWEKGVLADVKNPKILSSKTSDNPSEMKIAMFVPFKAKTGQAAALADFLKSAASMVEETEPKTAYWFAIQIAEDEFAIVDFFADQSGVDAHFGGKVAAALKANSEALIEGGWDKGIVANVQKFEVLVMISE
jgi:quinol monooxygenase YgiN